MDETYVHSNTLGQKKKKFLWKIDESSNIYIRRQFKNESEMRTERVTNDELNKINEYMKKGGWKDLANNVELLSTGAEKEGIGKFMYGLHPNTTYAQLSSHISSIFYNAGVWDWNGKERGMMFLINSGNWSEKTSAYYNKLLNDSSYHIK
jgi:hypothetical protein